MAPRTEEDRRALARHEAGHAVAICQTGGQILHVTLSGQSTKGHWERTTAEDLAIYHFAGSAAEARYLNRCFEEVLETSGCHDLVAFDHNVRKTRSKRWAAKMKEETRAFVERNWSSIERVAAALLVYRQLDHAAVTALIDG
jgi:hypothetical protein